MLLILIITSRPIWIAVRVSVSIDNGPVEISSEENLAIWAFQAISFFAMLLPFIAVGFRRLHDIGWSGGIFMGWIAAQWFLSGFLIASAMLLAACFEQKDECEGLMLWGLGYGPFIAYGILWVGFLFVLARPSQLGPNKYGPNPHEVPQ